MEQLSFSVDVREVLEDLGGTIALDADFELPVIEIGSESFVPVGPAHISGAVTNTGAGIVASGAIEAVVRATCSRCLREFQLEFSAELDGFYVEPGRDDEIPEEQEFGYITEGQVDLAEQILVSIALELPFAPLHDPDCPGLCSRCGADLTEGPCSCEPDMPESPFAGLKDMLPPADG